VARNEIRIAVEVDDAKARRSLQGVRQEAERTGSGMGRAFQSIQRNWLAVGAAIGASAGAVAVMKGMIGAASDMEESVSKVNVVFGESASVIHEWASSSATAMGQSTQVALEAAGTFGNLFTAMGLLPAAAAATSKQVIELSTDLASFNNLGTEEVLIALRSGLVGEVEPLRRLGIAITAATVKSRAMELGLVGVTGELTEQAKIQARMSLIIEQSSNAQGDFARTSGGLANQTKILGAQLENLQVKLGEALLGPITSIVQAMNDGIPVILSFGDAFTELGRKIDGMLAPFGGLKQVLKDFSGVSAAQGIAESFRTFGGWIAALGETPGGTLFRNVTGIGIGGGGPAGAAASFGAPLGFGAPISQGGAGAGPGAASNLFGGMPGEMYKASQAAGAFGDVLAEWAKEDVPAAIRAISALERALVSLAERQTSEIVEAFIRGGDEQVAVVRAAQQALNAAWVGVAADMRTKLGIEFPEQYRDHWEQMRAIQDSEQQRLLDERKAWAERLLELERKVLAGSASLQDRLVLARAGADELTPTEAGAALNVDQLFAQFVERLRTGAATTTPEEIARLYPRRGAGLGGLVESGILPAGAIEVHVQIGDGTLTDVVAKAIRSIEAEGRDT
jgi:hypothetical protein